MTRTKDHLQRLDQDECMTLLAGHPTKVGRLAFVDQDYPIVLPVNFRVHRGSVVFRSDTGSKYMAAATGQKVAFEVDDVDEAWQEGWSVLIQGMCHEITDPHQLKLIDGIGLNAWAGASMHTLEILHHRITGRRIV
ncbi:MAG: pyridoxamine 5'-phosphate oxidase family protein [Actinomycetota bacterium]